MDQLLEARVEAWHFHGCGGGDSDEPSFEVGKKWSQIAMHLPGRTDNEVKNYWNSYLKKRVEASNSSSTKGPSKKARYYEESSSIQISHSQTSYQVRTNSKVSPQTEFGGTVYDSFRGAQMIPLPKVLFADWLLNDHDNQHCPENADGPPNFELQFNSKAEDMYISGSSTADAISADSFVYGYGDTNIFKEFESQTEPPTQLPGGGFFDLLSMGEICGNFDVNPDGYY